MSELLEITGDDIAQLGDADLRVLIGRLCEADFRAAGLSASGITWGGHQDAKDGGLDVVVKGKINPPKNSFVPRKRTGFQVKVPDMPRAEIIKEMMPEGILREEIKNLIKEKGTYIIVSAKGSTTESALKNRLDAIREAVASEKNNQNLQVDFFDRGRVATWVRSHPSLILWVRSKIGRQLTGWHPYGNWAESPGGVEEEYFLGEELRLNDGTQRNDNGMSSQDGINRLRSILSSPRASVRLAGLSGVGKTRLVQALFDKRIGENALNPTYAFYTNLDNPNPDPKTFAEQLISNKTKAILVVDNCPPKLHNKLTKVCSERSSTISLLTVEYDVRDNLPEETNVFRLEPSSEELIEKIVRKRFKHIGQIDANTIAKFSGGNARVAIALANTVEQGETLSGFRDEELFERLFTQRNDPNANLLISAEALSLVYSFEGTDTSSEESELKLLASLINKSSAELYRDVRELKDRGLIQSRSVWRAILPHAIANRLAKRALESIPKDTVVQTFLQSDSERLIKSFARRLNYLHDCDIAVEIASDWLLKDAFLGGSIQNFSSFGMEVFKNVAPVSPEKTLQAIECAANSEEGELFTSRDNNNYYEFVSILRHLAYDAEFFERSVKIMCRFALSEKVDENINSTRDVLKSLFYIYLSGTHASIELRTKIIGELVDSDNEERQKLGLFLLSATMETYHFSSAQEFSFGARPRDYGYHPELLKDVQNWYEVVINICTRFAISDKPIAEKARKILSNNLRGLWAKAGMFDALEKSSEQINKQNYWGNGWISVRSTIQYDGKGLKPEVVERLHRLEQSLKPVTLIDRARAFVLSSEHYTFDLEDSFEDTDDISSRRKKMEKTIREIGVQVAEDEGVLNSLLPDLVSKNSQNLHAFGVGLAEGGGDREKIWQKLLSQLKQTPEDKARFGVLQGFLFSCSTCDNDLCQSLLDDLVNDESLCQYFPIFQTTIKIDKKGITRLHRSLDIGKAKIHLYHYLACGRAHEPINDGDLVKLLRKIISKKNGVDVVVDILAMRFHGQSKASPGLIAFMREVLSTHEFTYSPRNHNGGSDYNLTTIAKICLDGAEAEPTARDLCNLFKKSISESIISASDFPSLLSSIATLQPNCFLDEFLENEDIEDYHKRRIFSDDYTRRSNALNQISDSDIIYWCEKDPENRYTVVASAIQSFSESAESNEIEWKPIVYTIFEKAPNLDGILTHLASAIDPMAWTDSKAAILERRSVLFKSLYQHENAEIVSWAKKEHVNLHELIKRQRELEDSRNRECDESFE